MNSFKLVIRSSSNLINRLLTIAMALAFIVVATMSAHAQNLQQGIDNSGAGPTVTHVVLVNETVESIATSYDVAPESIRLVNNIAPYTEVFPGQVLMIPIAPVSGAMLVNVGFTDTLDVLASRHATTTEDFGRRNGIVNPELIFVGQVLSASSSEQPFPALQATSVTQVTAEQPLWQLALQANQSIASVLLQNQLLNPHTVAPGHRILTAAIESEVAGQQYVISISPDSFSQGRTTTLRVRTEPDSLVSGTFLNAEMLFVEEDAGSWVALLPIARFQTPGRFPFAISIRSSSGDVTSFVRDVTISEGSYALEGIFISEDVLEALRDEQSVTEEVIYIRTIMSGFSEEKRWDDRLWYLPSPGIMSSGFGSSRVYNQGDLTSWHPGSDLAGVRGTPIYAPAGGVVVDNANLNVRGLVTIINHGRGVYTGYWHQQNIFVEPGDVVEAGQLIGEIGNTGLSTAPHLHWEMHVNGIPVEPLQWVREVKP